MRVWPTSMEGKEGDEPAWAFDLSRKELLTVAGVTGATAGLLGYAAVKVATTFPQMFEQFHPTPDTVVPSLTAAGLAWQALVVGCVAYSSLRQAFTTS